MLSDAALGLIREIFGRPSLFAGVPRIERRVVAWGGASSGVSPVTLPHSAVVVSERFLLESLGCEDLGETAIEDSACGEDFTVFTSRPLPEAARSHEFGVRQASAVEVRLLRSEDSASCWIESVDNGWLFLIPNQMESTWLLAIGATPPVLLAQSRLIAPRVELTGPASPAFAACPRTVFPLCGVTPAGSAWLTCGSAAMAFDPICGDGTANAVREAILAAAVIKAVAGGGDRERLFAHYQRRLVSGMQKHLALCADYYRTGGNGIWWQSELERLREGFEWCGSTLAGLPEATYRLRGLDLEEVA